MNPRDWQPLELIISFLVAQWLALLLLVAGNIIIRQLTAEITCRIATLQAPLYRTSVSHLVPQNAYCEACGGFDDLGAALRCSTCPHQYHPDCLTPEQRAQRAEPDPSASGHRGGGARAPTGWVCPHCTRRTQLGKYIDKILASRGGGAAKECRLKWVGLSYLHTEWVKLSELEEAATAYPGLRRRLAVFEAKQKEAAQVRTG